MGSSLGHSDTRPFPGTASATREGQSCKGLELTLHNCVPSSCRMQDFISFLLATILFLVYLYLAGISTFVFLSFGALFPLKKLKTSIKIG